MIVLSGPGGDGFAPVTGDAGGSMGGSLSPFYFVNPRTSWGAGAGGSGYSGGTTRVCRP